MRQTQRRTLKELILFGLFPAIIYGAQLAMSPLPNIHLTGMFIMLMTLLFRTKALIPLYGYVLLVGILNGFNVWWIPYLYIWTVLWGMTMLIPKTIPNKVAAVVYPLVCALHGLIYGTVYAPAQALIFGFDLKQTVAWIIAGLPFDAMHAAGNFVAGMALLPLLNVLRRFTEGKVTASQS